MTSWYIDPCYDPMQELHDAQADIEMLKGNCLQLAHAYNDQSQLVQQLVEQNKRLVDMLQRINKEIVDITYKLDDLSEH